MSWTRLPPPKRLARHRRPRSSPYYARQSDYLTTLFAACAMRIPYGFETPRTQACGNSRPLTAVSGQWMRTLSDRAIWPRRGHTGNPMHSAVKTKIREAVTPFSRRRAARREILATEPILGAAYFDNEYRIRRHRGRRLAAHAAEWMRWSRPWRQALPPPSKQKPDKDLIMSAPQQEISPPRRSI